MARSSNDVARSKSPTSMARPASSTHCAEATIVAEGGCSRDRSTGDEIAGGAGPPGLSPTCGGIEAGDADGGRWTGFVVQPQLNRNGSTQSTTRTNAPN